MSRKHNLLGGLTSATAAAAAHSAPAQPPPRPFTPRGAAGGMIRSIGDLAARADAAKELEARMTAGEVIVELEPDTIDPSFIADRMVQDDDAYQALRQAIADKEQNSPILVRPHPSVAGRYQVAFGHRRVRVARDLGRCVRAVVRKLTDEELALAQGQENSARSDLTFIERALFAQRLENRAYGRDLIMAALAVDKTTVSKMISVTQAIPEHVIEAIGPAPGTGRPRWLELASMFANDAKPERLPALLAGEAFRAVESDVRFDLVVQLLAGNENPAAPEGEKGRGPGRAPRNDVQTWAPAGSNKLVALTLNARSAVVSIDRRAAPGFGEYLLTQMERLFQDYQAKRQKPAG
jgi:ParB family transcriptional regulator, chromosome partitioning protein